MRKTIWTCDGCGKTAETEPSLDGPEYLDGWEEFTLGSRGSLTIRDRKQLCPECQKNVRIEVGK